MGSARPETGQGHRFSREVLGLPLLLMLNFPLIPGIGPVHDIRGTKMNARQLSLCTAAGALLAAGSGTAFAQSGPDAEMSAEAPVLPSLPEEPAAQAASDTAPPPPAPLPPPAYSQSYPTAAYPAPVYPAQAYPAAGASYAYPGAPVAGAMPYAYPQPYPAGPNAAGTPYPPEYQQVRASWISECAERYRHDRRDGKGGLIGGLLGAAIGGFAGNRIDDRGDRWAGTLIGAGVGGVAGAVIGTLAGRSSRRKVDDDAFAWCEDYLAGHTATPAYGYGQQYGYGYGAPAGAYGPVMMVPVMVSKGRKCQEDVVEEVAEPPRIRRYIPKPAPDKRIKLAPSKTKRIEYSKTK